MKSELILTTIDKEPEKWKLVMPFEVETSVGRVNVPKGFVTDLASVPRPLWSIFPPMGRYTKAAVVHDYLYFNGMFTKKEADGVFKELMLRNGVSKWKAFIMYIAVRWFGRGNY